jgi:hypothetical protein
VAVVMMAVHRHRGRSTNTYKIISIVNEQKILKKTYLFLCSLSYRAVGDGSAGAVVVVPVNNC